MSGTTGTSVLDVDCPTCAARRDEACRPLSPIPYCTARIKLAAETTRKINQKARAEVGGVDGLIRSAQGNDAARIDLNRELMRELVRATTLYVVRHSYPMRSIHEPDETHWEEAYIAWFLDEREAFAYAEEQRLTVDSLYTQGKKRRRDGDWPPGSMFGVREVSVPMTEYRGADAALAFCERMGESWLARAEAIRRRILDVSGV